MTINIILLGAVIVLIVVGAALVLFHVGQQPTPSSTATTIPTTQPITTAQPSQLSPYITQSQARTLTGTNVNQTIKVYNTSAEIATLLTALRFNYTNITKIWLVAYNSNSTNLFVNNTNRYQNIIEYVFLFSSARAAQTFYSSPASSQQNVMIRGTQNGMNYTFIMNNSMLGSAGALEGWKGNYVVWTIWVGVATKIPINASTLSSAMVSDLP